MSVLLGALRMGRAQAESRMTETVRVGVLDRQTDPDTFDVVQVLDVVYQGPARWKPASTQPADREVASQYGPLGALEVHLPSGTEGVAPDMRVVVDASTADASLVGRVARIKGFPVAGQTTAARFPCEETGEQIEVGS